MYDGNLGEIDFGSCQREVRVSEGSSYRESTVHPFHSISRAFARKRRKKFLTACLRHRFITTLRVSLEKESYDTKWFDYNEVVHIQHHRLIGN